VCVLFMCFFPNLFCSGMKETLKDAISLLRNLLKNISFLVPFVASLFEVYLHLGTTFISAATAIR